MGKAGPPPPPPSAPPCENSTKRLVGNYGYLHVDTNDSDSDRANIPRQILVLVMHGNIAGFLMLRLKFIEVIVLQPQACFEKYICKRLEKIEASPFCTGKWEHISKGYQGYTYDGENNKYWKK